MRRLSTCSRWQRMDLSRHGHNAFNKMHTVELWRFVDRRSSHQTGFRRSKCQYSFHSHRRPRTVEDGLRPSEHHPHFFSLKQAHRQYRLCILIGHSCIVLRREKSMEKAPSFFLLVIFTAQYETCSAVIVLCELEGRLLPVTRDNPFNGAL